jgi:hypothetical protein
MMNHTARMFVVSAALFLSLVALSALAFAADAPKHQFVGAAKCKLCHSAEKVGSQYPKWKDSKHAHAYETLASAESKEAGKKVGVDDPQTSPKCLKCHVTGYDATADMCGEKYDKTEGITCESCHGAGGDYWKKQTMQDIHDKKLDGATVGLLKPDEAKCKTCHNPESPFFKEFKYDEFHAKIVHLIPKP